MLKCLAVALLCAPVVGQEIIERKDPHNWTFNVHVTVRAWSERDARNMPKNDVWSMSTAAVVFPIPEKTSSSKTNDAGITSEFSFNDRPTGAKMTLIPQLYHSGTRLARWELLESKGSQLELKIAVPMTSFKTVFNETEAMKLPWPSAWPEIAASTFEPMMYIDVGPDARGQIEAYDPKPIENLLKEMIGTNDPKSIPATQLAKYIAGELQRRFQPSGSGISWSQRGGAMEGIDLLGAPAAAKAMRGSQFDMTCVLVALYRKAGLPARLVVGYDAGADSNDRDFLSKRRGSSREKLRSWAEFALVHPANEKDVIWVPVDVVRMRERSTSPAALDRPWPYFGTHDEMDGLCPFAFQFHPPTTVRAYGSPGFWGWLVTPEPPEKAFQTLRFEAISTPKRGDDPKPSGGDPRRRGGY